MILLWAICAAAGKIAGAGLPQGKPANPVAQTVDPASYMRMLYPPYPELAGKENIVVIETEKLARIIDEHFRSESLFTQPHNVAFTLRLISSNIRAGRRMNNTLVEMGRLMRSPEVESIILTLKRVLVDLPRSPAMIGVVGTYRKFVEMLVGAHGSLKSINSSTRNKGALQLDDAFTYFQANLWRFYDIQIIGDR